MSDLVIMCGLPASGKSSIAKTIKNSIIISTDDIREEINGNASIQDNGNLVFEIAFNRIKEKLIENKYENVVFDATNINYKKRTDIINRFRKYTNKINCYFVYADYEECLERNSKRKRNVPEKVIKRMYYNFYVPQFFEGFDYILFENTSNKAHFINELRIELNISQDNPNHNLTLLEHSDKAYLYLEREAKNSDLCLAGYLHDIGKIKTKTFINAKGEKTNIAHYYSHEKVGAYDSFAYTKGKDLGSCLYIAQLIQWHMLLHQELSEKTIEKYKNKFGEKFWLDLELLHEADLYAH